MTDPKPVVATPAVPSPSGYVTSAIRTLVPYLIGLVVAWAVTLGVPESLRATLTAVLTFAVGSGYYLAVRALERKWAWLGWFLGKPTPPVYK